MSVSPRRWLRAAALPWLLLATLGFDIDEDELHCEEAVAHLQSCCPDLDPKTVDCNYQVCSSPDLSRAQAECIEELSCEVIVEKRLCERVPGSGDVDAGVSELVCQ
jgi:hypothetical protein